MFTTAATKAVSVKLEPDIRARVENLAQVRHRSAHWVMREAISQYVEREEKRETFLQDAALGSSAWPSAGDWPPGGRNANRVPGMDS